MNPYLNEQLKYWLSRGGQIAWRLPYAKAEVAAMERDLRECDEKIKEFKAKIEADKLKENQE